MKNFLFTGILGLFLWGSCGHKAHEGEDHSGHNHTEKKQEQKHGHANCNHDHSDGHTHSHDHSSDKGAHDHSGHNHTGHDHSSHAHGSTEHTGDEIVFTREQADAAGVKVNTIQPGTFRQVIKTSGQITAAQGDEATVVATVAGVVSFRQRLTEGTATGRGATLLTLSSDQIVEGDPIQKARIAYEVSQREYERMKQLVADQIVSEREFAQAQQEFENARISYEAVARNHTSNGQNITAPIQGFVKSIFVKEGDYVEVGQPLVSITQNRKLFLRAEVSEKYYTSLRTIGSANFRTPYDNKVYALQNYNGRLLSYGRSSAEDSYYIPVTFEFDNREEIIPGSFVEVYLLSSPMENVISVPRTALSEEQDNFFVYIQVCEEEYKKQEVSLGADDGERVQILSGIHPGDRVVTQGAYQLKLASAANALPAHTHEH